MVQGLHWLEAMNWKIETEYLPYTNQVEVRFIPSKDEWRPGRIRAINRSYRHAKSPMWIGWFPSAKRPTRSSLCKRARHAKRPGGRR